VLQAVPFIFEEIPLHARLPSSPGLCLLITCLLLRMSLHMHGKLMLRYIAYGHENKRKGITQTDVDVACHNI
jgi:hypothetical protein